MRGVKDPGPSQIANWCQLLMIVARVFVLGFILLVFFFLFFLFRFCVFVLIIVAFVGIVFVLVVALLKCYSSCCWLGLLPLILLSSSTIRQKAKEDKN